MSEQTDPQPNEPATTEQGGEAAPEAGAIAASEQPGVPQFVSNLKSIEHQVGEHVIGSLRHPETVAVITAVMQVGSAHHITSIPLTADLLEQVQMLVAAAHIQPDAASEVPCVGFHCYTPLGELREGEASATEEE